MTKSEWRAAKLFSESMAGVDMSPWFGVKRAINIDLPAALDMLERAMDCLDILSRDSGPTIDARQGAWLEARKLRGEWGGK